MDGHIYKGQFDPIFLPGESARLITSSKTVDVECVGVGALPEYYKDFGALSAATWDRDNSDTNLKQGDWGLAQLRMRIVDDMKMELNNLGSTKQWRTSQTNFYLRQFPTDTGEDFLKEFLFKASEFFIYEDDLPTFDFYSDVALTTSKVLFSGWRFRVKKLTTGVQPRMTLWISGWPSGIN